MEFITDRTYADVLKLLDYEKMGWNNMDVNERLEWYRHSKGAFNLRDLERISDNIQELRKLLQNKFRKKIYMAYSAGTYRTTIREYYTYVYFETEKTNCKWECDIYNSDGTLHSSTLHTGSTIVTKDATQYANVIILDDTKIDEFDVYATDFILDEYVPIEVDYYDNKVIPTRSLFENRFSQQNLLLSCIPEYGLNYKVDLETVFTHLDFKYLNDIESKLELIYNFINTPTNQYVVPVEWNYEDTVKVINEDDVTDNHITTNDYIWFDNIGESTTYLYAPAGTVAHIEWYDETTLSHYNSHRMKWTSTEWSGVRASGLFKVTFYAENGVDLKNNVKVQQRYRLY